MWVESPHESEDIVKADVCFSSNPMHQFNLTRIYDATKNRIFKEQI